VIQSELRAGVTEGMGCVAGAIVVEDAPDDDAKAFKIDDRRLEVRDGARGFLIRMDLVEGDAGGVIDADGDVLPAASLAPAAGTGLGPCDPQ
jgi:hypothetical protein